MSPTEFSRFLGLLSTYDQTECFGLFMLFDMTGSVYSRVWMFGVLAAVVCLVSESLVYYGEVEMLQKPISNNYIYQITSVLIGITIVFRTNLSYRRFWEGIHPESLPVLTPTPTHRGPDAHPHNSLTPLSLLAGREQLQIMSSKLGDAALQAVVFDLVSRKEKGAPPTPAPLGPGAPDSRIRTRQGARRKSWRSGSGGQKYAHSSLSSTGWGWRSSPKATRSTCRY